MSSKFFGNKNDSKINTKDKKPTGKGKQAPNKGANVQKSGRGK